MSLRSLTRFLRLALALALAVTSLVAVQANSAQAIGATITIVQSGGAAEGSGWTKTAGVITATSSVSINASEVTAALASGDLKVDAGSITVNSALVWANSSQLTLESAGALNINANVWASGASAGLVLNGTYQLAAGAGVSIQLSGATPSLHINGQVYTVVNTLSQLTALTSSSTYVALGRSIALTDTYADSLIKGAFASVFDGLGNEVTGLKIDSAASGTTNLGFFAELRGATIRNLGVTNVNIQSSSVSDGNQIRVGAIAGSIGDASLTSGQSVDAYTTVLDRVWSSGSVYAKDSGSGSPKPDVQGKYFAGGLVGSVNNGMTQITNSHSSASVGSAGTMSGNLAVGGLIGDSGSNKSGSLSGDNTVGGQRLIIERSYATGTVVEGGYIGYYGTGGLVGVFYGDNGSYVKDSFSWTTIVGSSDSVGGIWGVPANTTQSMESSYTTFSRLSGGGPNVPDSTYPKSYSGVTNSTWTALPTFFSSDVWQMTSGSMPILKGQATPQTALYVKVVAPTNGTYATMSFTIVNGAGVDQDLSALGLTAPTGTAEFSIPSTVAVGTYSVSYVSGLELSGTNAANYFLAPYPTPTSVTITSASQAQTVTWSPANTAVTTNGSPLTPNPTASTTAGGGAISYSIQSDGGTACKVDASTGVLTFTAVGDCVVRAYAAGNSTYASAYQDVVFTVATPLSQTVTWAPTNTSVTTAASPLTPSAVATSSGTGAISYGVQSAGTTSCTVNTSTGVLTFSAAGTCVVRATAASNATYSAATKDVTFTVTALQVQTVTWAPTNTALLVTDSPVTPSSLASSNGTGSISYSVQNAGTTSCSVNSSTAVLTFASAGSCVIRATAAPNATYSSATKDVTFTIGTATTSITLNLDVQVGNSVTNGPVNYSTTGLKPGSSWDLILRSTPQTLASGSVAGTGIVVGTNYIPSGLGPGWHSLTMTSSSLNGGIVSTTVWFEISSTGVLLSTQTTEPASADSSSGNTNLPNTGFPAAQYLLFAALLLLLGAGLVGLHQLRPRD